MSALSGASALSSGAVCEPKNTRAERTVHSQANISRSYLSEAIFKEKFCQKSYNLRRFLLKVCVWPSLTSSLSTGGCGVDLILGDSFCGDVAVTAGCSDICSIKRTKETLFFFSPFALQCVRALIETSATSRKRRFDRKAVANTRRLKRSRHQSRAVCGPEQKVSLLRENKNTIIHLL